MSKIFDTNDVVVLKVDEDDLMSFLLKWILMIWDNHFIH